MIKLYDYIYRIMWYIVVNTCEYIYIYTYKMYTILWIRWNVPSLLQSYHQNVELKTIYIYINPPCPRLIMFCRPPKMWSHQRVPSQGLAPCISASEKGASCLPNVRSSKQIAMILELEECTVVFLNLKVMSNTFLLLLVCNLPAQRRAGSWTLEVFLSPPKPLIFPGNMTKSFLWFPDDPILGIPSNCGRIFMRKWW